MSILSVTGNREGEEMTQWMLDIGMLLITIAVFPQVYRTWKNRHNIKDLDKIFVVLTLAGNIFASTWGLLNSQYSLALLNLTYLVWTLLSIIFMVRARRVEK